MNRLTFPFAGLVGAFLLALSACGDGAGSGAERFEGEVRSDPLRLFGVFDGEEYLVILCDDSEAPVPVERSPIADDLVGLYDELVPRTSPGEAIFIDVLGEAIQDGDDVSLNILEVYRAGWEDWGCTWESDVDALAFAASGTEPGWYLEVAADSTLRVAWVDGTNIGRVNEVVGSLPEGWTVSGVLDGSSVSLDLEPEACRNAMSGGYSHLSATLRIGDRELTGCGFIVDPIVTPGGRDAPGDGGEAS